jgi:hypothetical protein
MSVLIVHCKELIRDINICAYKNFVKVETLTEVDVRPRNDNSDKDRLISFGGIGPVTRSNLSINDDLKIIISFTSVTTIDPQVTIYTCITNVSYRLSG